MDVGLESIPTLNCSDNLSLYIYLRDVLNESAFTTSVLQVLIEVRRASHRAYWNKNRSEQKKSSGEYRESTRLSSVQLYYRCC